MCNLCAQWIPPKKGKIPIPMHATDRIETVMNSRLVLLLAFKIQPVHGPGG